VTPTAPTLVIHTVESGDTLSEIAAFFGVSVATLAEANGLGDVHYLSIGQELIIPLPGFDPDQASPRLTPQPDGSLHLCSGLDLYSADEASRHVDEFACVEFRVVSADEEGQAVLLTSNGVGEGAFAVSVEPEWQDCWAEGPERRFEDRVVRVRGTIEGEGSGPQIAIGDCSQIELVPSIGR
jgi:LysM repeat protein